MAMSGSNLALDNQSEPNDTLRDHSTIRNTTSPSRPTFAEELTVSAGSSKEPETISDAATKTAGDVGWQSASGTPAGSRRLMVKQAYIASGISSTLKRQPPADSGVITPSKKRRSIKRSSPSEIIVIDDSGDEKEVVQKAQRHVAATVAEATAEDSRPATTPTVRLAGAGPPVIPTANPPDKSSTPKTPLEIKAGMEWKVISDIIKRSLRGEGPLSIFGKTYARKLVSHAAIRAKANPEYRTPEKLSDLLYSWQNNIRQSTSMPVDKLESQSPLSPASTTTTTPITMTSMNLFKDQSSLSLRPAPSESSTHTDSAIQPPVEGSATIEGELRNPLQAVLPAVHPVSSIAPKNVITPHSTIANGIARPEASVNTPPDKQLSTAVKVIHRKEDLSSAIAATKSPQIGAPANSKLRSAVKGLDRPKSGLRVSYVPAETPSLRSPATENPIPLPGSGAATLPTPPSSDDGKTADIWAIPSHTVLACSRLFIEPRKGEDDMIPRRQINVPFSDDRSISLVGQSAARSANMSYLRRNVRVGLKARAAAVFPRAIHSQSMPTEHKFDADNLYSKRSAEECKGFGSQRIHRMLYVKIAGVQMVEEASGQLVDLRGISDAHLPRQATILHSRGEWYRNYQVPMEFGIKKIVSKESVASHEVTLVRPVYLMIMWPSNEKNLPRLEITGMRSDTDSLWPNPLKNVEWEMCHLGGSISARSSSVSLTFKPKEDLVDMTSKSVRLIVDAKAYFQLAYNRPMDSLPATMKSPRSAQHLRIAYTAMDKRVDLVDDHNEAIEWDEVPKGAYCALCRLGDLGGEEELRVHYSVIHGAQYAVHCVSREERNGTTCVRLRISYSEAMLPRRQKAEDAVDGTNVKAVAKGTLSSEREEEESSDRPTRDGSDIILNGFMDDPVYDNEAESANAANERSPEDAEAPGSSHKSSNQPPRLPAPFSPSAGTMAVSLAVHYETAPDFDIPMEDATDATVLLRSRGSPILHGVLRDGEDDQSKFYPDDAIMQANPLGLMQPQMRNRRNQYTDWSSRIAPGTVLDLLPALDELYDGGRHRFHIRLVEDRFILFRTYMTEKRRFVMCVWNRWRAEVGPMTFHLDDRMGYLKRWLDKYSPILRKGELEREVKDHLLNIRLKGMIDVETLIETCRYWHLLEAEGDMREVL